MKTQTSFLMPARLRTAALAMSGSAHVAGEKSARDRHASKGVERAVLIQVPAGYRPTAVPTQNVAPSAHERGT